MHTRTLTQTRRHTEKADVHTDHAHTHISTQRRRRACKNIYAHRDTPLHRYTQKSKYAFEDREKPTHTQNSIYTNVNN